MKNEAIFLQGKVSCDIWQKVAKVGKNTEGVTELNFDRKKQNWILTKKQNYVLNKKIRQYQTLHLERRNLYKNIKPKVSMKHCLLLLCCLFPKIIIGQIVNGSITLVFVDSVIPNLNQPYMGNIEDTVLAIVDSEPTIHVINENTKTKHYERRRDTVDYYFTNDIIVSNQRESDLYRLYDMKLRKSMNIIKNEGKYEKRAKFNMFDDFWYQEYATKPVLITKNKCEITNKKLSSRSEYYEIKSTQTHNIISQVEICLTKDIQIPIRILLNYSKEELACPLFYTKREYQNISEIRLLSCKEMSKEVVLEKMNKEILKFLEDR